MEIDIKKLAKIVLIIFAFVSVLAILGQIAINVVYTIGAKNSINPNTYFEAKDLLNYFGLIMSVISTAIFGYITYTVTEKATQISKDAKNASVKANEINEKFLMYEKEKYIPQIDVILLTEEEYKEQREVCRKPIRFGTMKNNLDTSEISYCIIGDYSGYNFLAINLTDNYIHRIELKKIKVSEIDNKGNEKKVLVDSISDTRINDSNTYLRRREERYLEIMGDAFEFASFDYRKYEITFKLCSGNIAIEENISFEVQNVKDFYFQRNKSIKIHDLM